MTLPGGPADRLGNRYEKLWTISEIVKMLMGFSDSIRIEDPAVQKAEFVVTKGGLREFHQTKRVNQSGKWSLAALAAKDGINPAALTGSSTEPEKSNYVMVPKTLARVLCSPEIGQRDYDTMDDIIERESVPEDIPLA